MYCKTYQADNSYVLACCDKELLGKNLRDDKYDITISEGFYKGEIISEEKLSRLLLESNNINLFGKRAVGVAIKQGLLTESGVIKICGIDHAIILKV